jgi:hypothetical protein
MGMCIVLMYILVNKGAGVAMVGGMRRFCVCRSWQKWQVQMNHAMSAFMFSHQNWREMSDFMANIIL